MNLQTGRPDHIEDYLARLHTGLWYGWSDINNKVYTNLIVLDKTKTKPDTFGFCYVWNIKS